MELDKQKIWEIVEKPDKVNELDEKQITFYLSHISKILDDLSEPSLMEFTGKEGIVIFVGDTHGDFETTKNIVLQQFLKNNTRNKYLVFLGDYIDRTPLDVPWGSINNITYLLILKLMFPKQVYLLKGNHEAVNVIPCYPYEFKYDLEDRFGKEIRGLHGKYLEVFSKFPLMIKTGNGIFVSHSGILKGKSLRELRNVNRNNEQVLSSIVWSDPLDYGPYRGPVGDNFSNEELKNFLENIGAKVMIRGHDYSTLGYSIYDNTCLTIFSSRLYANRGNSGVLIAKTDLEKIVTCATDIMVEDNSSGSWKKYKVGTI